MSGGQQQRVAIARALVNEPSIILADEPTGNLDSRSSLEIMDLLHELHDYQGATIVMVTHEPDIAEHAGRVIFLRDGKIVPEKLNGKRHGKLAIVNKAKETGEPGNHQGPRSETAHNGVTAVKSPIPCVPIN